MVEVPLEIDAELPREFEGAALLASSGLPRKVKIKAARDTLKLSTAYRADQLVSDIVRSSLRGTAHDVQRVQEAVTRFIRTVRERRQDGATLTVSSNGRGKIDVVESLPGMRAPPSAITPAEVGRVAAVPDKMAALERRLGELESGSARAAGGDLADRVARLEERLNSLQAQLARTLAASEVAGPGMERPGATIIERTPGGPRRTTAVEAYAEGLRNELRARASTALSRARSDQERCDKAAALAAEAELLGAPRDGTAERLREASAQTAARETALERLSEEIDLYLPADLPVAAQLLHRLEDTPAAPDPAPSLEPVGQEVVRAAKGGDCKRRTAWLKRAALLCGWKLVEPEPGSALNAEWHQAVDSGGSTVVRLACPGIKRADGSGLVRARVHVDPAAASLPEEPDELQAVPEPLAPPPSSGEQIAVSDETGEDDEAPSGKTEEPSVKPSPAPAETPPPQPAFSVPFGDLAGEGRIKPEEATAAAAAASRIPKIVSHDPTHADDALAAEVALAVEKEMSEEVDRQLARDSVDERPAGPDEVVGDADIEEVQDLSKPLPDEPPPSGKK